MGDGRAHHEDGAAGVRRPYEGVIHYYVRQDGRILIAVRDRDRVWCVKHIEPATPMTTARAALTFTTAEMVRQGWRSTGRGRGAWSAGCGRAFAPAPGVAAAVSRSHRHLWVIAHRAQRGRGGAAGLQVRLSRLNPAHGLASCGGRVHPALGVAGVRRAGDVSWNAGTTTNTVAMIVHEGGLRPWIF
jgi:hypothetical protein